MLSCLPAFFACVLFNTMTITAFVGLRRALPARFRRPRWLIIGCGDVGLRVQRLASSLTKSALRGRVYALTSSPERLPVLRAASITPLLGNLDQSSSLRRLAGLATHVLHLAPPPGQAADGGVLHHDPRTLALARSLRRGRLPQALVYASTSGVYGDCAGAWVAETRPVAPATARAQRRVHAETVLRRDLGRAGVRVSILRVPGIYAPDREGGTPRARLLRGTAVLQANEDVFTNHIHADDLAQACRLALWRGAAQRIYHASDNTELRMGDYFDLAADLYGLPRPPRWSRHQAQEQLPPLLWSFMGESRRLENRRLRQELRLSLRYPTVVQGLCSGGTV
ncbi:NAD-binding protein [Giesbergeria giesbergeri]